jgi:hypothetical protein
MNQNHMKKIAQILIINILFFYSIIQGFCNRPGDWGEEPLSQTDLLYFIITIVSTVGLGDITPKSDRAKKILSLCYFTMIIEMYSFIFSKLSF